MSGIVHCPHCGEGVPPGVRHDCRTPRIDRTRYVKQEPPAKLTLYFCPACGKQITGTYNLEPARKSCTKRWHLAEPVGYDYELVDGEPL